ncbi:hypothetical protein DV735_g1658, partial [Chaetothyriales sp. CBS 134920]
MASSESTQDPDLHKELLDADEAAEEIDLQNDSAAYFDKHNDSIFCIAQHPTRPSIVVTGGGDDVAYIFDATPPAGPKLDAHGDSVNAVAFTLPHGEYVVTAGLDGQLRAYQSANTAATQWKFVASASEVEEINWVEPSPSADHPNTIALGANDGSVWVYTINAADAASPITIVQAFYLHTASCTAGAWTPDGKLLATVSEDGSLYVFDVFASTQPVVSLTADDKRFEVDGGLYSVACTATMVAVGGAGGNIKVVAQTDGVETLSFSSAPLNLLAAGSVDGSIALFDTAHRFTVRRLIKEAHEEYAVVKVAFVRSPADKTHILTSAGMDGVVRRWDARGGTTAAGQGFINEWRGHRGEGEGGGVLGFVQGGTTSSSSGGNGTIVTAGDDGVALVFQAAT